MIVFYELWMEILQVPATLWGGGNFNVISLKADKFVHIKEQKIILLYL